MNEFNKFLCGFETESTKKIEDMGRIETADIYEEPIWVTKTFTCDDGTEKQLKRIKLKICGDYVDCPISVIGKLKAISEKLGRGIKAFTIVKSGSGIKTEYNVMPELEPAGVVGFENV